MFCCILLYVHSSIAIVLIGKIELFALLKLSSWYVFFFSKSGHVAYQIKVEV